MKELDSTLSVLAEDAGIEKEQITEIVAAGNTVMEHIFREYPRRAYTTAPIYRVFLTHPSILASELGFNIAQGGIVKVLPNVAGYVGADIVAGVAAHSMDKEKPLRLLVDIGTNNELVIGNEDSMYCCATAAGPAFEGARISQGMRASIGAIEKVEMTKEGISYKTIGNVLPTGLCGSGLIDVTAVMISEGIIDSRGRMKTKEECNNERFRERLSTDEARINRLQSTEPENPVYSHSKISVIQLAVGAVKVE